MFFPTRIFLRTFSVCLFLALLTACASTNTTPLTKAAGKGDVNTVRALLEKGVAVDEKSFMLGNELTALHWAAYNGRTDIVRILLEAGADMNFQDVVGYTPLHYGAFYNYSGVVSLLLDAGADHDVVSQFGTPLQIAQKKGYEDIVDMLRGAEKKRYLNTDKRSKKPLVKAKLGEIQIWPFTLENAEGYFKSKHYLTYAEKDLNNKLRTLLGSPGLFGNSTGDLIDITAKPVSIVEKTTGDVITTSGEAVEIIIEYEFSADDGDFTITETIVSQGASEIFFSGPRENETIRNGISANLSKLSNTIKEKLPNAWRSYAVRRENVRQQIANSLKKENRDFRVISAKAIVRKMPVADTKEVSILHQSDIVHVTGSLPSGWLQVSREGEPIGWVHSSLLREDFASSPPYRPVESQKVAIAPTSPHVTQVSVPVAALDFGTYHALVIGNNNYREIKKLHTAVSDAQAINALLQDKYGFKTRLLLNATRADILRAINDYRRRLGPRDNLLIYYAGHGWLDKDADQGYWLPVDATEQDPTNWISNGSITDSLRAMEAKHVLVIADSCYSGKLSRGINVRVKTKNYYKKISVKKARTVMASGGLEPVADEGGKGTHSVFASALIEALNENQGVIDTTLLFSQIRRPVMVNTDQTPEYSDIRKAGHDGGDFLFVRQK